MPSIRLHKFILTLNCFMSEKKILLAKQFLYFFTLKNKNAYQSYNAPHKWYDIFRLINYEPK